VTVNGTRVTEVNKGIVTERDKSRPSFDAKLDRGSVNKIEVEILASKPGAVPGEKDQVEWEKLTCFVHCLRT
jgi:RSC chromatin remodeling complex RSC4-like protein